MMSLLLERDRQLDAALEILNGLSEILEQEYEESEDIDILLKFCIVKSDIARLSLGLGEYEAAVENGSTALDLSQDLTGLVKTRLSSQITVGLGHYFLEELEDAIDVFQTMLAESNEDVDVMLLVARALWAMEGDQERQIAIQQIHDWYLLGYQPYIILVWQKILNMLNLSPHWVRLAFSRAIGLQCNRQKLF